MPSYIDTNKICKSFFLRPRKGSVIKNVISRIISFFIWEGTFFLLGMNTHARKYVIKVWRTCEIITLRDGTLFITENPMSNCYARRLVATVIYHDPPVVLWIINKLVFGRNIKMNGYTHIERRTITI